MNKCTMNILTKKETITTSAYVKIIQYFLSPDLNVQFLFKKKPKKKPTVYPEAFDKSGFNSKKYIVE